MKKKIRLLLSAALLSCFLSPLSFAADDTSSGTGSSSTSSSDTSVTLPSSYTKDSETYTLSGSNGLVGIYKTDSPSSDYLVITYQSDGKTVDSVVSHPVTDNYSILPSSVISGGTGNVITGNHSVISGGYSNEVISDNSVISGGNAGKIGSDFSVIIGGISDYAYGYQSTIVGGSSLNISGPSGNLSTLVGGSSNHSQNTYGTLVGGSNNVFSGSNGDMFATVVGGSGNYISNEYGTVVGGSGNQSQAHFAVTVGGTGNQNNSGSYGTIVNGINNSIIDGNSSWSSIFNGSYNSIDNDKGDFASIFNGEHNRIDSSSLFSSIFGGLSNTLNGSYNSIYGGQENYILNLSGDSSKDISNSSIFSGSNNSIHNNNSLIINGNNNYIGNSSDQPALTDSVIINGQSSMIAGSNDLVLGGHSIIYSDNTVSVGGSTDNVNVVSKNSSSSIVLGGNSNIYENSPYTIAIGNHNTVSEKADHSVLIGNDNQSLVSKGMAIGNEAVASESSTIAFGHLSTDISHYDTVYDDLTDADKTSLTNALNDVYKASSTDYAGLLTALQKYHTSYTSADAIKTDIAAASSFDDWVSKTVSATKETTAKSVPVAYGSDGLSRLVKVADGVDSHDAVTMEQLDKAVSDNTYKAGDGILIADDKTISLNHFLSTNLGNLGSAADGTGKVTIVPFGKDSYVIGGSFSTDRNNDISGGVSGDYSLVLGGSDNLTGASNSVIVGGEKNKTNKTSITESYGSSTYDYDINQVIIGGSNNTASGRNSVITGGQGNTAYDQGSMVLGGYGNTTGASSDDNRSTFDVILGGSGNASFSNDSVIIGGLANNIGTLTWSEDHYVLSQSGSFNGILVSSNSNASNGSYNLIASSGSSYVDGGEYAAIIASNHDSYISSSDQSAIISSGVSSSVLDSTYSSIFNSNSSSIHSGDKSFVIGGSYSGVFNSGSSVLNGTGAYVNSSNSVSIGASADTVPTVLQGNNSIGLGHASSGKDASNSVAIGNNTVVTAKNSMALGFKATASYEGTISFGHKKGDISGYSVTLKYDTSHILPNGNTSSASIPSGIDTITENTYTDDFYNRLVNIADGIDDHDAATVAQVKKAITNGGINYTGGSHISVTSDAVIDTKNVLAYDSDDNDVATLAGKTGTKVANVKGGAVSASSMEAINGSQLYTTNQAISGFAKDIQANTSKLSEISTSVSNANNSAMTAISLANDLDTSKADVSLSNLSNSGKSVIASAAVEAVQNYFKNANSVVTSSVVKKSMAVRMPSRLPAAGNALSSDSVSQADLDKKADITYVDSKLDTKADKSTVAREFDTLHNTLFSKADISYVDAGLSKKADQSFVEEHLALKADKEYVDSSLKDMGTKIDLKASSDASNIDVDKFTQKLDTGAVEAQNKGLVSGSKVYDAVKNKADKDYVDAVALGLNQEIAGTAEGLHNEIQQIGNKLNKDINRAAAGSNALAALHPMEYDPDDRFNFAAGYGHYRGANATAIGAYYYPNANTMISVGTTVGNGSPSVNAGISVKLGKGSVYNGVSKAELVKTVSYQEKRIEAQDEKMKEQDERIAQLEEMVQKLMKK